MRQVMTETLPFSVRLKLSSVIEAGNVFRKLHFAMGRFSVPTVKTRRTATSANQESVQPTRSPADQASVYRNMSSAMQSSLAEMVRMSRHTFAALTLLSPTHSKDHRALRQREEIDTVR